MKKNWTHTLRQRRHRRVRAKIMGTSACPRFSIFRSNRHLFIQLIDDAAGKTLLAVSDQEVREKDKKKKGGSRVMIGGTLGEFIAKKAGELHIARVVFDRGGYKYHGIVKAVAGGARKGGLKF